MKKGQIIMEELPRWVIAIALLIIVIVLISLILSKGEISFLAFFG